MPTRKSSGGGVLSEGPYFLDTNILVYRQFDLAKDLRAVIARALINQGLKGDLPLALSPQILREFYSVITKSAKLPFLYTPAQAARAIQLYVQSPIRLLYPTEQTLLRALRMAVRKKVTGPRVHDVYIAATMLDNQTAYIFTENPGDFTGLPGITAINPFAEEPWKSRLSLNEGFD